MKRDWLLRKVRRISTSVLVPTILLAGATAVNAADNTLSDDWRFTITPYVWVPTLNGTLNIEPPPDFESGKIEIGPSSYLNNLKFIGMGEIQAQKGRWSFLADTIYVDFADPNREATIPAVLPGGSGLTIKADTSLNALIFEPALAYSVVRNKKMNFDLLAGARYARIETKIGLDISGLPPDWVSSGTRDKVNGFLDPILGFKGKFELGKKWHLPYYFDIGGFGAGSQLTTQAAASIDYSFTNWFSMGLGYRYLHYDFGDAKLVKTLNLKGVMIGLSFSF